VAVMVLRGVRWERTESALSVPIEPA